MPDHLIGRVGNLIRNARDRGGRPMRAWLRSILTARRNRDERDLIAERASSLGFIALNDCVERAVADAGPQPTIEAPALLLRSTFHNPVRFHDYSLAANCAGEHMGGTSRHMRPVRTGRRASPAEQGVTAQASA